MRSACEGLLYRLAWRLGPLRVRWGVVLVGSVYGFAGLLLAFTVAELARVVGVWR